jgi:hypothetical protein
MSAEVQPFETILGQGCEFRALLECLVGGVETEGLRMGCGAREVGGVRAYVCLRNGRW